MRTLVILIVLILIVAAAPRSMVDDLVRRGNAAFETKDYAGAVRSYEQAEALTTDPGLVAFNKASALYQLALSSKVPHEKLALFRRARDHYRCAADDPAAPRRRLARFGLANSLLQGHGEDVGAVREAIACYRDCLKRDVLDESLLTDTRHNLEVAKLTLVRLLARRDSDKPPPDQGGNDSKDPPKKENDPKKPPGMGDSQHGSSRPQATEHGAEVKNGDKPTPTKQHDAGKGNLEPIADEMLTPPLSVQEAVEEIDLAVQRILLEQRSRRYRSSRVPPGEVKDW